jgi:hypothetical protein
LIISSEKKKEIKAPKTKKGPKGSSEFIFLFLKKTNPNPIIAPTKEATNKVRKTFGNPKKIPRNKANFTSPKPIHLPFEKNHIKKKNKEKDSPERTKLTNCPKE